jgi:hypothetical protein
MKNTNVLGDCVTGFVNILCGSLLACRRVLPAAAVLQFHPKCPLDGPAQLLLGLLLPLRTASQIPPMDLQAVECFFGAHTLEALLSALRAQGAATSVLQQVQEIIAEVPQRCAAPGALRRTSAQKNGSERGFQQAWDVDGATRWRWGCLLRLTQFLLETSPSQ